MADPGGDDCRSYYDMGSWEKQFTAPEVKSGRIYCGVMSGLLAVIPNSAVVPAKAGTHTA
jgi:hypothetical protein